MQKIVVSGGKMVEGANVYPAQVLIEGSRVAAVVPASEQVSADWRRVDARGGLLIPGAIDPHVHLQLPTPVGPSSDDFWSGTRAALAGGTTSVIDFVTPHRGEAMSVALNQRIEEARDALTDVAFHMGITWWDHTMPAQMRWCVEVAGIRSFKVYLAYGSTIGITLDELRQVMTVAVSLGAIIAIHAEDGPHIDRLRDAFAGNGMVSPMYHALSRPPETEITAVKNVIRLVRETGCTVYFVHISTAEAARHIGEARVEGLPVLAETCIQYLVLDERVYDRPFKLAAPCVISPPLRSVGNVERLWQAVKDGVFDVVSTDHCPFNLKDQKDKGSNDFRLIPNGAGGVEYRLQLLYSYGVVTGLIGLSQWISLCSSNAARIFQMGSKGRIAPGMDADLVIWNQEATSIITSKTQYQQCDSNIYEGIETTGKAGDVIRGGELVYSDGHFLGDKYRNHELN